MNRRAAGQSRFSAPMGFVPDLVLRVLAIALVAPWARAAAAELETMADLMTARLEVARRVAWIKFQNGSPVNDPAREAEVLGEMVAAGRRLGLDEKRTEAFFKAQMKASRAVQAHLIRKWTRGATLPSSPPASLAALRVELDRIGNAMLAAWRDGRPGTRREVETAIRQAGFSTTVAWTAARPLPR